MPALGGTDHLEGLEKALQKERDRLEALRYRFVVLELLMAAREVRYWAWALQDLNRARLRAREADLMRAAAVGVLDLAGAGPGMPTLREVAAAVPAPWSGILRDHHDSLSTVVTEIEVHAHRIAEEGRACMSELARTGTLEGPAHPSDALAVLVGSGPSGRPAGLGSPASRLQAPGQAEDLDAVSIDALVGDVINGGGRLRIPALIAFLR